MRNWWKNGLLAAGAALAGAGLGACESCDDYACAPCTRVDNLMVRLDTDTPGGFGATDVRGAYVVRYTPPGFTTPLDTARQELCDSNLSCFISLEALFPNATTSPTAYTRYNYRFVLPGAGRSYDLSGLDVASQPGNGSCCSCASNVRRRYVLDGVAGADDGQGEGNGVWLRR